MNEQTLLVPFEAVADLFGRRDEGFEVRAYICSGAKRTDGKNALYVTVEKKRDVISTDRVEFECLDMTTMRASGFGEHANFNAYKKAADHWRIPYTIVD
jgi:hypothetical protein